jgi:uncharacterized repeat protein (TIGR03803 family)
LFKLNTDGTGFSIIKDFDYFTTGGYLQGGGLVQRADGTIYGTANQGGSSGAGTVFQLNPDGTDFSVFLNFDNVTTGGSPYGKLIKGTDGNLYGTTSQGGGNGAGTVFRLVFASANNPPVAKCKNVTVSAGAGCTAAASIDDGSFDPDAGDTIMVTQSPAGPYALGDTLVTLTVTDNHGVSSTCTATVTVEDKTAPAIPVLADVIGQCSATVTAPTTTDNCAGTVTGTTSDPLTYSSQGTFTVHWIFSDGHGNSSAANQTVIVRDTIAPIISGCPANIIVQTGPGRTTCDQVATWTTPTASDNCTLASFISTHASGATFPVGTTTVIYTAKDGAIPPHTVTCSFTVTVQDNTPPVIATCVPAVSVPFGGVPAAATTVAEFLSQGGVVSDNCGLATTVTSSDSVASLCPTIVTRTYTIKDTSGNSTTCQQTITVNNLFADDGIVWHQPLARNGASEDTDPSADGTLKYRFKLGSTIPIQIHAQGCSADVTANANVIGKVVVFGDTDMNGVADAGPLLIDYNGIGEPGGIMDKIGDHLKYNLDTKKLPQTTKCYLLQVTVTDTSTGESYSEIVPLQPK